MKVMFVLAGLGVGGAERVISLISRDWVSRGVEVTIVSFDSPDEPIGFAFDSRIELVRLAIHSSGGPFRHGVAATMYRCASLRKIMRAQRPDIVLSFLTKINVITLLASYWTGIPVIISERNNPKAQQAHPLWYLSWKTLARRAQVIVLQTNSIRRLYPAVLSKRATVIPNVVELPEFEHQDHEGHVLVSAGRLVPQKGYDLLIRAFAKIAAANPDWRLVIWGEGKERERLEAQIRDCGLEARISLPGNSPRPLSWVECADLFVLSSRHEGFGNVLVEAMLAELPVVSFNCDFGPGDIISEGVDGLLVRAGDADALARTLALAMADPALRKRLASHAIKNAQRFRREHIVRQWEALITRILSPQAGAFPDPIQHPPLTGT
ncbi:glycosyltransferase [Altererythrobacter salegens]|uniref:Glycosyltransferase n=2 Tax=Croceibacterium salegens TaxID=1737568 RepID=A0A6I4SR79_9SPHN|nr:glycosyltransferase [Croceibacterium salegens]